MRHLLLYVLLLLPLLVSAQQSAKAELDKFFDRIEKKDQGMGCFSIVKNGEVVYQRAFGYASVEDNIKATPVTKYLIGSVSKTFTAAIILQMVHEQKLSLQTTVSHFYPNLPNAPKITIEHLLRHRSGIHNFGEDRSGKYDDVDPQTREEILEVFRSAEVDFKPGSQSDYNNANYLLLSLIAEEVDSATFAEILQVRIAKPLNLQDTYLGDSIDPVHNEAHGYYGKRKWHRAPRGDLNALLGAGAIVSTTTDVALFYHALLNNRLFPDSLVQQMKTLEDGIGLGLYQYPFGSKRIYGHAGNIGTFSAMAGCFADGETSFALCLNGQRMDMNEMLVEALKKWFGM